MNKKNSHEDENFIAKGLQDMLSHLEEGGPEVVRDDVIAYVHQFLPTEENDIISKNIVRYRTWNQAYRDAMRERIAVDRLVRSQNWLSVWKQSKDRPSLPMPTSEETACLSVLAAKTESIPIRRLFQSVEQQAQISNLVHLQQIAEGAVQHGFLSAEQNELESSEESEELTLRGGSETEPQTEIAFQLAQPSEELLAAICQKLLENETLTPEIKQNLLTLADALHLPQPLKESFADWLREL